MNCVRAAPGQYLAASHHRAGAVPGHCRAVPHPRADAVVNADAKLSLLERSDEQLHGLEVQLAERNPAALPLASEVP